MLGSTKNSNCSCATYSDLEDYDALEKRKRQTKKILASLTRIVRLPNGKNLSQCPVCGQYWQTTLEWMSGNKPYVFKVPSIDVNEWVVKPFVCPDELFVRTWHIVQYLEKMKFVEKPETCKSEGCTEHAIRMSGLCAFHHMENIGIKSTLPEECTWFGPYTKEDYEFTIERLKKLPSYTALQ